MALTSGKIDAVIIDNQPAKSFVETTDGLQILDTDYVQEDYAAAIQKGNTDLLNAVNGALKELKEDGTLQKILDTRNKHQIIMPVTGDCSYDMKKQEAVYTAFPCRTVVPGTLLFYNIFEIQTGG